MESDGGRVDGEWLLIFIHDFSGPQVGVALHDLRGTADAASEADCSLQEIATITGHSLRDVGAIIDRYTAVAKLEKARG